MLPEPGPGDSVAQLRLSAPIECVPDGLRSTLQRGHELFAQLQAEPVDGFKLITRRTQHMLNSALQNVEKLKARGADVNPLWIHPDDAARLGLGSPTTSPRSPTSTAASAHRCGFDPNLRPGVVAMTHGFGNRATAGMPNAQAYPGVNVNLLGPSGAGSFDPVSGMLQLTGIPVSSRARSGNRQRVGDGSERLARVRTAARRRRSDRAAAGARRCGSSAPTTRPCPVAGSDPRPA